MLSKLLQQIFTNTNQQWMDTGSEQSVDLQVPSTCPAAVFMQGKDGATSTKAVILAAIVDMTYP